MKWRPSKTKLRWETSGGSLRAMRRNRLRLEPLEPRQMLAAHPLITELMASNGDTLVDADGEYPDWFEVHNPTQDPISLLGYTVTDNPDIPDKWAFSDLTLEPGAFLEVFASGKDRSGTEGKPHTNFRLSSNGENLALISPEGIVISEYGPNGSDFPEQFRDISYGIIGTDPASEAHYFTEPTPGAANNGDSIVLGVVTDTTFTVDRGFYDVPFDVVISTATPGATMVLTSDGTKPTLENGTVVSAPDAETPPSAIVGIDQTTVLRARAFKEGYLPTNVDSQTYLFLDDIVRQDLASALEAGFPARWKNLDPDYDMDVDVIGEGGQDQFNGRYTQTIRDDLKSIPTMSLVMDIDDLFGERGIYVNTNKRGVDWERPVSVEYIDPNSVDVFQIDAGIRMQGANSRLPENRKHNLRLLFKDIYGAAKLEFPLFGEDVADRFDTLVLRANNNDGWAASSPFEGALFMRDEFGRRSQLAVGQPAPHGTFVHLYINGIYWGLYNPVERPDDSFSEMYFGGNKDQWDVISHAGLESGSDAAWKTMNTMAKAVDSAATEAERTTAFLAIQGKNPDGTDDPALPSYLDMENYIDYLIVNFYVGNFHWPHNNWYATRLSGDDSTGFKFMGWDMEGTLAQGGSNVGDNRTNVNEEAAGAFGLLRASEEFRLQFADHVHRYFFNNGVLTPEANIARFQEVSDEIFRAMVGESARWGDMVGSKGRVHDVAITRDEGWAVERASILNDYLPQRTDIVLDQFRRAELYSETDAPEFQINGEPQHGGSIVAGADLTLDDLGQIGELNSLNRDFNATPDGTFVVDLPEGNYDVQVTLGDFGRARDEMAIHVQGALVETLNTEANEFLTRTYPAEVSTTTDGQLNLRLDDTGGQTGRGTINALVITPTAGGEPMRFDFGNAVSLVEPGYVGVKAEDTYREEVGYGWAAGTVVSAVDRGKTIYYSLGGEDPRELGGAVSTTAATFQPGVDSSVDLEGTTQVRARLRDGSGKWSALIEATFVVEVPQLHITELNYNPYALTPEEIEAGFTDNDDFEFVELINGAAQPANLQNLRFTDGVDFTFGNTPLDPGERVLVVHNQDAFEARYGSGHNIAGQFAGGQLSNRGETLRVEDPLGMTIIEFTYDDGNNWPGRADGKGATLDVIDRSADLDDPDNWRSSNEYGGSPGTDGTGPLYDVIVNEVLTNPPGDDPDLIELHNGTESLIDISGWYLSDDSNDLIKFAIPAGTTIDPGAYITLNADDIGFALDEKAGSDVWLLEADQTSGAPLRFADHVDFDGTHPEVALGRWRDADPLVTLFPMTEATLGSANSGPVPSEVVLAEVHYHPMPAAGAGSPIDEEEFEFIELYNTTQQTIDLENWKLDDAIEMTFAAGTTLEVGQTITVVGFDPADGAMAEAFRDRFGIDSTVMLIGPYNGNLRNGGESLKLLRPQSAADSQSGFMLIDAVTFDDEAPWPVSADGDGKSLQRTATDAFGNFVSSWRAADPSPGSSEFTQLGDMDRNGRLGVEDIAAFVLGLKNPASYEAQFGVAASLHGDTDGDGDLDFDDIDEFVDLISPVDNARAAEASITFLGRSSKSARKAVDATYSDNDDIDELAREVARQVTSRATNLGTTEGIVFEKSESQSKHATRRSKKSSFDPQDLDLRDDLWNEIGDL